MPAGRIHRRLLIGLAGLLLAGCPDPTCPGGWQVIVPRFDRAMLSAWGRPGETYVVGGGLGVPGAGALAARWDGESWSELAGGRSETLWWVWGSDDGADVWMVGERGLALRRRAGAIAPVDTGTTVTLFGVWGTGPDDVWLVGGSPGQGAGAPNDVVLRWDGQRFTVAGPPARGVAFFKVWGAGGDVWVAGEAGSMWRWTGGHWEDHAAELATVASVTTVHGCAANDVWAVAGNSVYHFAGAAWAAVPEANALAGANGIACSAAAVLVVGNGGMRLRLDRTTGLWHDETFTPVVSADFHGAFAAPDGTLWAAGGNFNAPAAAGPRVGTLAVYGCPAPTGDLP